MTWIRLRSPWDPVVWLPLVLVPLVLAALVAWAQASVAGWQEALNDSMSSDPERAVAEATRMIRLCEAALCASSLLSAAFLYRFFTLGLREGRLPPSGWWSIGAWRMIIGPKARRMSRMGLAFTLLLPVTAVVTVLVVEYLLWALLAGGPTA